MTDIDHYLPAFIGDIRAALANCPCLHCQTRSATSASVWRNQVRHSALLECETVAHAVLFDDEPLALTSERKPGDAAAPRLDPWQNTVNQACINLCIASGMTAQERLFAVGVLLGKCQSLAADDISVATVGRLCDELMTMAAHGALTEPFQQLPKISTYKVDRLRALGDVPFDHRLIALGGETFAWKLNELPVLSDNYLAQLLDEMSTEAAAAPLPFYSKAWTSYMLYCCYSDVFPGDTPACYSSRFLQLCGEFYAIDTLCRFLQQSGVALEPTVIATVFSAWRRAGVSVHVAEGNVDPLLVAFSLIN